ncbi:DNA ligase 1-like isoform X2 [Topomyia yanbarensis]|uniref:DNA ligase 1-like isoform X2 n=1 Tax=Topomyia yanbarensis TaxID=2498891 RepID=UPI00273C4F60|nr:DNA ligase 1-like isoform X2 [Topomyia yanbarensis]
MSTKKPVVVEAVLPEDNTLATRSGIWRTIMDKYSKTDESKDFKFNDDIDCLYGELSDDDQPANEVESSDGDDSDQENREEMNKQLSVVVKKRKRKWQRTGLSKLMASIEDQSQQFNMLSQEKVENWLSSQFDGIVREMTQGQETVMSERNEDGDKMRFHRKQQLTVSSKDDEDSLFSVDTAKYILSNRGKNNSYSKLRVTTTIQQYTLATRNTNGQMHPKLHSISTFPAIDEEHLPALGLSRKISKSDSFFETGENQDIINSAERTLSLQPAKPTPPAEVGKSSKRKKVFKKTMKKKAKNRKSPKSSKASSASQEFEQALQSGSRVKKGPLIKSKKKQIRWQETSYLEQSHRKKTDEDGNMSSSSSEPDEVFTRSKPKQVTPPKRELRRRSNTVESDTSPRKKSNSPRQKSTVQILLDPFNAICLSPSKKHPKSRERLDFTTQIDQTTNMTALFIAGNDKITNSTEINNVTSVPVNYANTTTASTGRGWGFPDKSRCLVIYKPRQIELNCSAEERVRITMDDLDLTKVTKQRHLDKFKKFNYVIHPNSTVRFYPSDSEEDIPRTGQSTATSMSDEDESFDEDDPILTFNPRNTDRLNVMECPYN